MNDAKINQLANGLSDGALKLLGTRFSAGEASSMRVMPSDPTIRAVRPLLDELMRARAIRMEVDPRTQIPTYYGQETGRRLAATNRAQRAMR